MPGVLVMEACDQPAGDRRLGVARIGGELVALKEQLRVARCHAVGDRHHLAVDLVRRLGDPDVVAQRLAHLVDPVEPFQEWEDGHVLGRLVVGPHDVAPVEQVEELVGAADLDVGVDGY